MTETAIQKQLETRIFGRKTFLFSSIDSTNTFAKSLALDGASEGTVVVELAKLETFIKLGLSREDQLRVYEGLRETFFNLRREYDAKATDRGCSFFREPQWKNLLLLQRSLDRVLTLLY